ncbi:unnamed protein product [Linum trigynum]|uniref:Uncharacterized protein n=1 Tax=Linum trigynum TaxID=586398 RepID=A0AAV2DE17_9ROSI
MTMMGSPYPSQKLNFNRYIDMQLNGMNYETIGASNPSFNKSNGLLPNVGWDAANLGLTNQVSSGCMNVAPTLTKNEPLSHSYATSPFTFPSINNNDQDNYLGLSRPLGQQVKLFGTSNGGGGTNNHVDVISMMDNISTNLANDHPSFGDDMFNHHILDDIEKSGIQPNNSTSLSSDTNQLPQHSNFSTALSHHTEQTTNLEVLLDVSSQQEAGVTKFTLSSDNSYYGAIEMNNRVSEFSQPNFFNESSNHFEQTTNLEMLLEASSQANTSNCDYKINFECEVNPINEKQQIEGVAKFTFSNENPHYGSTEVNSLVTELPPHNLSNELSHHIEQTTNLELLLDGPSKVQGVCECANPTNFADRSNLESEFNSFDDKLHEESERGTIEFNLNNSFLPEIEALLENKDWADQFVECLPETENWTSF